MLPPDIKAIVAIALAEDVGGGDLTAALIPSERPAQATVVTREDAVLCGIPWFLEVYAQLDPAVSVQWDVADGDLVRSGQLLCRLTGPARSLLTGERTALNFLQTLSGTATLTRRYVEAVAGTHAAILDTRKTLPGLRQAQKYAVAKAGGRNHRMGLYDAFLIKENHIMAAGSIQAAVRLARSHAPDMSVEVEVEDLAELEEALEAGSDVVLLDNFDLPTMANAVVLNERRAKLEASGNVSLEMVRAIAETGVDFISVGSLTKDLRAVDLSLRFQLS
jgi:nicotinate-nucleotide pyrophosphorylase (carboxylating)